MRVTDVRVTIYAHPMPPLHGARWGATQEISLVEVHTDEGVVGYASARAQGGTGGRAIAESILKTAAPRVIGQDPFTRERIWQQLARMERAGYLPIFATSAIDVALWDIVGKALGQPLWRLLGGYRDRMPAYASSAHMATIEEYLREVEDVRRRGYPAYKIHPIGEARADVALCRAVREVVGPDYPLMLDPGGVYTRDEAIRVGRVLEALGFVWYEEPLRDYDLTGYAELSRALDIPVQVGEVVPGHAYLASEYIMRGAGDHLRSDVYWKGGITGALKMAHLAEAFNMPLELHHAASPIMNFANLHVACAIPNCDWFEVLVPEDRYDFGLVHYANPGPDGYVTAPDGPGLGVEIDWDWVRAHQVDG
ncbi:MAG: mandelate racemase [Chloroflexi bacterium]|nr:mandelate racemase [Chloroflexota bacterium]